MSADEQGYNGWTNYETWCVSLWLGNEEPLYLETRDMARSAATVYVLSDQLREFAEGLPPAAAVLEHASFVSDLLGAALTAVDWDEIATNLIDEVAEDDIEGDDGLYDEVAEEEA